MKTIPPPPKPPPLRMIRESDIGNCPRCHSSTDKKYWLWGPKKCINLECGYDENKNINNSSNRQKWNYRKK